MGMELQTSLVQLLPSLTQIKKTVLRNLEYRHYLVSYSLVLFSCSRIVELLYYNGSFFFHQVLVYLWQLLLSAVFLCVLQMVSRSQIGHSQGIFCSTLLLLDGWWLPCTTNGSACSNLLVMRNCKIMWRFNKILHHLIHYSTVSHKNTWSEPYHICFFLLNL